MQEQQEILLQTDKCIIKKIISPIGFSSELYNQDCDEWCTILSGSATLNINGTEQPLSAGEYLFIQRHTSHQIISTDTTQETVWLAVYIY